jgi:adenylate kinase family enzyme
MGNAVTRDQGGEPLPRRIVVVGPTGSGKTTLARGLASVIGGRHIELDALFWNPDWQQADAETFRARTQAAVDESAVWAACGNYSVLRDILWSRAEMAVWLDFPFRNVAWQLFWRSLRRGVKREELWNGNRERLSANFFSRESLFIWLVKSHRKNHERYGEMMRGEYAHLRWVRLGSPREARRWLTSLGGDFAASRT